VKLQHGKYIKGEVPVEDGLQAYNELVNQVHEEAAKDYPTFYVDFYTWEDKIIGMRYIIALKSERRLKENA
jgi:hypothetical protein